MKSAIRFEADDDYNGNVHLGWYKMKVKNPYKVHPIVDLVMLAELLPHGSGINDDYTCYVYKNGNVKVSSDYHKMNGGCYVGWIPFSFRIYLVKRDVVHNLPNGKRQLLYKVGDTMMSDVACKDVDLRSYLEDTIHQHIVGAISYMGGSVII